VKLKAFHEALLADYRSQNWRQARKRLAACREVAEEGAFNLAGFYDLLAERIDEFQSAPPGLDWDGVYVAATK